MTGTLVNGNVKPCIIHLRNPKINANVMLEGAHLVESAGSAPVAVAPPHRRARKGG